MLSQSWTLKSWGYWKISNLKSSSYRRWILRMGVEKNSRQEVHEIAGIIGEEEWRRPLNL